MTTAAKTPVRLVRKNMHLLAWVLWLTGVLRMYRDGNSTGAILRPWHPLSWVLLVFAIVPCALNGVKLSEAVPMRLSKFWRLNRQHLQWVTPFTDLNALPEREGPWISDLQKDDGEFA